MTNSKEVNIIETIRGQIATDKLSSFKLCLFHERVVPTVHAVSSERPLNIQHVQYHRSNLLSLQNTSLTAGMIDHQLQQLLQSQHLASSEVILLDGSNYESKVPQILQKYTIVKGYQYRLSGNPPQSQKSVLLSKQHIYKQLQYQFKLGNGKFKPGFIGELSLKECIEKDSYFHAFQAYLQFSAKSNCLIVINASYLGRKTVNNYLRNEKSQGQRDLVKLGLQIIAEIQSVLKSSQTAKAKRVVIYNIPFIFQTTLDQNNFVQTTNNIFHSQIIGLFQRYECYFGFDLSKYSEHASTHYYIAQLLSRFPKRIILSCGLTYKTDLTTYGGYGYMFYKEDRLSHMIEIANRENVRDALANTKHHLLGWKIKMEQIKIIVKWKCSQCIKEQSQQVQSFRKFGKQFCSIKCLKGHKF